MHQLGQESSRVFSGEMERKYPHGEWGKHKAGSALRGSFVVEFYGWKVWPLVKNLLRDSDYGKLSLSGIFPWVC